MTTFGLEDVRESFHGDVSRFLTDVEKNAISHRGRAFRALAPSLKGLLT